MGRIVLIATIMLGLGSLTGYAQTEKGNIMVGAGSMFDFTMVKSQRQIEQNVSTVSENTTFQLTPSAGIFLVDNFLAGISVPLTWQNNPEILSYVGALTMAYYIGQKKLKPFVTGSAGFGQEKYVGNVFNSVGQAKPKVFMLQGGAGLALFIHDKVAIEFGLIYMHTDRQFALSQSYTTALNEFSIIEKGIASVVSLNIIL